MRERTTLQKITIPALTCMLGVFTLPGSAFAQWQNDISTETPAQALHGAHAIYNLHTENSIGSLKILAQLRKRQHSQRLTTALHYAAAGLPRIAEAITAKASGNPLAAKTWLAIAQSYYRQHDFAAAQRILAGMNTQTEVPLRNARASLLARCLLHQGQFDDAALSLAASRQFGEISRLDRYNLAIAWLGAGAHAQGAGELDALGRYTGEAITDRALADQANLALGYWLLRNQRPRQARAIFWRILLSSPMARKGMLGLGWSEILDAEQEQSTTTQIKKECLPASPDLWQQTDILHKTARSSCRIPEVNSVAGTLATAPGYESAQDRFGRAAAAWQATITGADPLDPVVAEAISALPYAIKRTGDLARAQTAYAQAIDRLQSAQRRLAQNGMPRSVGIDKHVAERLEHIGASLNALQRHAATLSPPAGSDTYEQVARDVADILHDLRTNAPANRQWARPTAIQRGRLLQALSLAQRPQPATGPAEIQTRITHVQARIADAQQRLSNLHLHNQQREKIQLGKLLNTYLRQTSLGLANISAGTY